jgi:type I restriction enzyme M protein
MLSPRLRQEIYTLWTRFWSGGLTNPITAIEQITYLLFLKQLAELDKERVERGFSSIYGRRKDCTLDHHPKFDALEFRVPLPPWVEENIGTKYDYCQGHNSAHWAIIRQAQAVQLDPVNQLPITQYDHLSKYVFPWLRELDQILTETTPPKDIPDIEVSDGNEFGVIANAPMENAAFQLPPDKPDLLQYALETVDALFKQVGQRSSANYDLMGDVFEYMLDEIRTSGKNGQFRTPRHIIRFIIELLDPKPGDRIVDPAAGTCGFLINSLLHLRFQDTDDEVKRLEWNGAPLRASGSNPALEQYLKGDFFTAFENDQTMARIGWMNMILHGVENPRVFWRDSLSKRLGEGESDAYDFAFANPPYTGNVDTNDLSELATRFPRTNKGPITNKSELLFVWLMLDLLRKGGKGAVIVPEGVLFNSTNAHKKLRRQLLFENKLEAVISLPAGVFQPYTGVKTSILVFQKYGEDYEIGREPVTGEVWFYEVTADGYTLDAKRNERYAENDLWDGQQKFKTKAVDTLDYNKPDYWDERWREIDDRTLKTFPELREAGYDASPIKLWGIHELFKELPQDAREADAKVIGEQSRRLAILYERYWEAARRAAYKAALGKKKVSQQRDTAKRTLDRYRNALNKLFNDEKREKLEEEDAKGKYKNYARKAMEFARGILQLEFLERTAKEVDAIEGILTLLLYEQHALPAIEVQAEETEQTLEELNTISAIEVTEIVREFAKLDGFDVKLRSLHTNPLKDFLEESLSWSACVRVWLRNDEWESEDGTLKGSHDEEGNVRPQYMLDERLYNKDKSVKTEYLDPNCIEANDLSLASGRYKPFILKIEKGANPEDVIGELQGLEARIQEGLTKLMVMVRGTRT